MRFRLLFLPLFVILFFVVIVHSCSSEKSNEDKDDGEQALVSIDGKVLRKQELDDAVPKGLNTTDSTLAAEAYIKMWIKDELMYEKAKENLTDKARIDELVENYRQSLTVFTYQEQLLTERLSKETSEKELKEYYEKNTNQFELQTNIIKGLFLKVPLTSPRLEDLRKWYQSTSDQAIENIEKYSLQNAVIYDLFYDRWVNFDDVTNNIPYLINDSRQFLQRNKRLEVQDSSYVYLLNIKEYLLSGDKAPYEYAKGQILDILLNQKRESFMKKVENDLYNDAIKSNKIKFHIEQP